MANVFGKKLWVLDTAGGGLLNGGGAIVVNKIRWVNATTAGHTAVLADANGNPVWESICAGANYVESDDFSTHPDRESGQPFNGLDLTTLGSGKLYIYFG